MDYFLRFEGGPIDGWSEPSRFGGFYPTVTCRQLIGPDSELMGIYQYDRTVESDDTIERIYRYQQTLPITQAEAFVVKHSYWPCH